MSPILKSAVRKEGQAVSPVTSPLDEIPEFSSWRFRYAKHHVHWNLDHSNYAHVPEGLSSSLKEPVSPSAISRPCNARSTSGQPPLKKLRPHTPNHHPAFPSSHGGDYPVPVVPASIWNTLDQVPSLSVRLSNPQASPAMLNKMSQEEPAGVRTIKMARGLRPFGKPSHGPATPTSPGPIGRMGRSRSPDAAGKSVGLQILEQVDVVELLEQDERPTFIIDLASPANFQPGPLNLLFANASLLAFDGLLDTIMGHVDTQLPDLAEATAFNEFKAWSTSYVRNSESLDVTLPSFFYGGTTWTCCSLKKRLRLIRGSSAPTKRPTQPSAELLASANRSQSGWAGGPGRLPVGREESSDYFGKVDAATSVDDGTTDRMSDWIASDVTPRFAQSAVAGVLENWPLPANEEHAFPIRTRTSPGSPTGSMRSPLPPDGTGRTVGSPNVSMFPSTQQRYFDWTRLPNTSALPPHIQFARRVDWASGPLGPMEDWSSELRTMCNLIMASPHPAAMYWGEDLIAIYNEAYILLAGQKHPQLMGQKYRDAWSEIWDAIEPIFVNARETGQATMKDDDCLFIERSSLPALLEETYFSWSLIPLVGEDGSVVGFYNPAFEKTRRKIAERRMHTLRDVGEATAAARDLKGFWQQLRIGLEENEYDTPFVVIYSVTGDPGSDASSMQSDSSGASKQCVLEGSLGLPDHHPAAPAQVDLKGGTEFFAHAFRTAMKSEKPVLLQAEDGTLDATLLEGVEWRGFGDPCTAAVCCPIHLTGSGSVLGFLLMGVNPRRPYDDDYDLFVQLLSRQLATSMASVVLFEEEIAKGQREAKLAAIDRIQLSVELAARTEEAAESETKFTRLAEFAPVGIFIANSHGRVTYCNDMWYEITRVPKGATETESWIDYVKPDDKEKVMKLWDELVHHAVPMNAEFRFQRSWEDPNGNPGDTWALASAYPEKSINGQLKGIFGSLTNISRQKWAEHFEKRRMEEAIELKRQQENFIDITSHEMRNPLSAILQCADQIATTLTEFRANRGSPPPKALDELMDNSVDAAQTIALCAQHQKRIVDDILTLSKLDSALLLVTPTDVMPITVAQRALKMFDGEVLQADIHLEFRVDESLARLHVEWVRLDPSRLLQVLINLTTNAIKFTTTQEKRIITVTVGASLEPPVRNEPNHVSYFPSRAKRKDPTNGAEWGLGEKVLIHFAVQDTGRGLTQDEIKLLFLRFSQASPRTHVQYGGSGLGLFISRELVELQGGEIGVSSRAGEGSTFAFYVKGRRSSAPLDTLNQSPSTGFPRPPAKRSLGSSGRVPRSSRPPALMAKKPVPKSSLRILIVEDNLVNQRVLEKQLRNLGCVVYVANHGGECLDELRETRFWAGREEDGKELTVILMDLEMPVMDGLECARTIRRLQQDGSIVKHVPIIAVSANARLDQMETALAAGMVSSLFGVHAIC